MPEIIISEPLSITMNLIEVEERLPSFKMLVKSEVVDLTGSFTYQREVWFECSKWDFFVSKLNHVESCTEKIILIDMDEDFTIAIEKDENTARLNFKCSYSPVSRSRASLVMTYDSKLDKEALEKIKNVFNEFPKWW
ncbi:MAG: hypothetical protein IAF08_01730 [Rhizobacter sp.]|nr:hypothetical protein [Chlorobiales bacterium]